jgi:hypothetical protein
MVIPLGFVALFFCVVVLTIPNLETKTPADAGVFVLCCDLGCYVVISLLFSPLLRGGAKRLAAHRRNT